MQVVNPVYVSCYFGLAKMFYFTAQYGTYSLAYEKPDDYNSTAVQWGMQCSLDVLCESNGILF